MKLPGWLRLTVLVLVIANVLSPSATYPLEVTPPKRVEGIFPYRKLFPGEEPPLPPKEVVREEALRTAVRNAEGLIFGFHFTYRKGPRKWGEISYSPQGHLSKERYGIISEGPLRNGFYRVILQVEPPLQQIRRFEALSSLDVRWISGQGIASFFRGFEGREVAFRRGVEDALKKALSYHYRVLPQWVEGDFYLSEPPSFRVEAGYYLSSVRVCFYITQTS